MNATEALIVILVLLAVFLLSPLITIAAINTLFGTSIAYTFINWLSALWLHVVVGSVKYKR